MPIARTIQLAACLLSLSAAAWGQTTWSLGRFGHRLANVDGGRVLLFGGAVGPNSLLDDTWLRDATRQWTKQITAIAPQPRAWYASASVVTGQPGADKVVVFGGRVGVGGTPRRKNDTWVYEGGGWGICSPGGTGNEPSPRERHAMTYDPIRDKVVLFGGFQGLINLSDTWEWDPNTDEWVRMQPATVPPPRSNHAMAYDVQSGKVLMYGGQPFRSDTWEWDGNDWSEVLPAQSPPGLQEHSMELNGLLQQIVLFGGKSAIGAWSRETWVWDCVARTWVQQFPATSPPARSGFGMAFDNTTATPEIAILGGENENGLLSDSWSWNGAEWTQTNPPPEARSTVMAAYDIAREVVVLFGGSPNGVELLNETWLWDGLTWRQATPDLRPPRRIEGGLAYDESRQRLVLFGGWNGTKLDDTWEWDGINWAPMSPAARPSPRQGHRMVYDNARQVVMMFGGDPVDDTWTWDGTNWVEQMPAVSPPRRTGLGLAYDRKRDVAVMFGGRSGTTSYSDTWEWDGAEWTEVTTFPSPAGRQWHGMVYDDARDRTVVYGGRNTSTLHRDTWEWDGFAWRPRSLLASPPPRHSAAIAYDRGNRNILMFSGLDSISGPFTFTGSDTWLYAPVEVARFSRVGRGCPGSTGVPNLFRPQRPGNWPWLNSTFTLGVGNLPPSPTAAMMFGSPQSCGGVPLPLDLAPFGAPGCTLYVCDEIVLPLAVSELRLTIPNDSTLIGETFNCQAVVVDPVNPLGMITSLRGAGRIGAK